MINLSNFFLEVLFSVFVFTFGLALSVFVTNNVKYSYNMMMGYPLGISVFVISSLPFVALGFFSLKLLLAICSFAGMFVVYVFFSRKILFRFFVNCVVLFFVLCCLFCFINLSRFGYDSLAMISIARVFAMTDYGVNSMFELFSSWGAFNIISQAYYMLIGLEYSSVFSELMLVSILFGGWFFFQLSCDVFKDGYRNKYFFTFSVLLLTTPFVLFQSQFYHNSLTTSSFLFVAFVAFFRFVIEGSKKRDTYLFFVVLLAALITRTENAVLVTLLLVFCCHVYFTLIDKTDYYHVFDGFGFFLMAVYGWYVFLINSIGEGSDILSPVKAVLVLIPISFLYFYLLCVSKVENKIVHAFNKNILSCMFFVLVFGLVALVLYDGAHFINSFKSFLYNLALYGQWGLMWGVIFVSGLVVLVQRSSTNSPIVVSMFLLLACFFILLHIYVYARIPYRIGWGDSANRMVTHLYPMILLSVSVVLVNFFCKVKRGGSCYGS